MPVTTGKDSKGCFARWGNQKKYYYPCGSEAGRKRAKQKAHLQGAAIGEKVMEKEIEIVENFSEPFSSITEASIDADNYMIKGVCVFGTDKSLNNRIYKNKAIESLTRLTNGTKMYINHPSVTELKDNMGVRDVRNWAGIFNNSYRDGNKILANLQIRESYWELLHDVAVMQPHGTGFSINAKVKVFADEKGLESVEDVASLKSVDLVAQAATTKSLFEAAIDKENEKNDKLIIIPGSVERIVESLFIKEGVIQDKLNSDLVKNEINNITWTANRLIEDTIYNDKTSIGDKKKKVIAIFDDLGKEVKKRLGDIKEQLNDMEESEMDVTLEMLRKDHSDLIEAIVNEYKEKENVEKTKIELQESVGKVTELQEQLAKNQKEIDDLKSKNRDLAEKLDKKELIEKAAEKRKMIDEVVTEAKLPAEALSDIFRASLMRVEEYKDGENTVTAKEQIEKLVEDRRTTYLKGSGKITGSGDEFKEKNLEEGKSEPMTEDEVKETASDFVKKLK